MPDHDHEHEGPHIIELIPDPVIASIGRDEPFLIVGRDLTNHLNLCASYRRHEVPNIYIVVDRNSTNSDKRVHAIVTPTKDMPPEMRNIELKVSIKDDDGHIIESKGVLIVS